MSSTRVLLPEPLTPVTQVKAPRGIRAWTWRRLFFRRPDDLQPATVRGGLEALFGHGDGQLAGEVFGGERMRVSQQFRQRTRGHEFPAPDSRPGPEVEDVVRMADGVGVVFHDQHGVAEVAQALQGPQQAIVVPLMQADARFVEDVKHANQPRSDLGRQADALGFAAAERAALPG